MSNISKLDHLKSCDLLKQITQAYGSVAKCPENDKRLIKMRHLLHVKLPEKHEEKKVSVNQMPIYAFYDDSLETIKTKNDFSCLYEYAIKNGCTLRMACRRLNCSLGKLNNFIRCKNPMIEQVVMFYGGQRIVGKSQLKVVNMAREMGFHGTMNKAIKECDLHKEIIFAPVIFNCLEVCK